MNNLKEALAQDFIFLHGDKKYSKEHQFIACERSRNETHVIVGYAYRWFSDAKTTVSQYAIPISDWEDKEKFITFIARIHRMNVVIKRLIIQMMISWKYMINIK